MTTYYVRGFGNNVGTVMSSAANQPFCALWNNAGTRRIRVTAVALFMADFISAISNSLVLRRSTTRGNPESTITPASAENDTTAPPSGAALDMGVYTPISPLVSAKIMACPFSPSGSGVEGSGFWFPIPRGIVVPAGKGLAISNTTGESMGGPWEAYYEFED